jgi:predicted Co/Zn/Cd cation transporter (cation efflux family)
MVEKGSVNPMAKTKPTPGPKAAAATEARALSLSMWGNLFMGCAGVLAAILSNSQAILMDGLFSIIGFTAALLGKRIAHTAEAGPDRLRPFGYAADEAIFTTFRSLSLLGLVLFAVTGSIMQIVAYANGEPTLALKFEPMVIYFVVIGITCALLWGFHSWAWRRGGRRSDILRLEATAAGFDGLITLAAGAGLVAIYLFRDGFLAPIAPVGDSIIVMILCLTVVSRYSQDFMAGLGELAGITANPRHLATARRALRLAVAEDGGTLTDLSVSKLGRSYQVAVYYDPGRAVTATEIDVFVRRFEIDLAQALKGSETYVVVSEHGRRWDDDPSPLDIRS